MEIVAGQQIKLRWENKTIVLRNNERVVKPLKTYYFEGEVQHVVNENNHHRGFMIMENKSNITDKFTSKDYTNNDWMAYQVWGNIGELYVENEEGEWLPLLWEYLRPSGPLQEHRLHQQDFEHERDAFDENLDRKDAKMEDLRATTLAFVARINNTQNDQLSDSEDDASSSNAVLDRYFSRTEQTMNAAREKGNSEENDLSNLEDDQGGNGQAIQETVFEIGGHNNSNIQNDDFSDLEDDSSVNSKSLGVLFENRQVIQARFANLDRNNNAQGHEHSAIEDDDNSSNSEFQRQYNRNRQAWAAGVKRRSRINKNTEDDEHRTIEKQLLADVAKAIETNETRG
ncbi:predicted protein [Chaetoceros tenuissimus]|uniref:Uncharacterized protein n=1 Tax=Chaetoceros tenuissimus TaxID=426638 RepID=A0AAD3D3G1_9STRA|nr:predicted protein [Chaetoceros tenuissimus]